MPKMYTDTYIYRSYSEYEKELYSFILNANRIDTKSKEFEDIIYDIKRRKISDNLVKIVQSNNVVLGYHDGKPLPKALKVFVAKDHKTDKNIKVFIDVTDCVYLKDGAYQCAKLEWLISYIMNAMVSYIYTMLPNRIIGNASILKDGGTAFVACFSYIIDRMYKIATVQQLKKKVEYAIALYWQVNILQKDINKNYDSIKANAINLSDIEARDAAVVDVLFNKEDFATIDTFIQALSRLGFKDLKTSNVIALWMQCFGTGTVFALEYFPNFSAMLTNTYIGGYIDQQITIEKITGTSMVAFVKTIIQIGASVS